jgi:dCMP deaminase
MDNWDKYFLAIAKIVSTRATCPRKSVGAVLVKDRNVLATGYNGSVSGFDHCTDKGCLIVDNHCLRTVHAETNAILQAAKHGTALAGATCYVTHAPCINCLKNLLNAGVGAIIYGEHYGPDLNQVLSDLGSQYLDIIDNKILKMDTL